MEVLTQPEQSVVAEPEAPVEEKVLIREITLRNILSFGPQTEPIPLRGLNVLIGPNGSGKSNLIEAIALLRAAKGDLSQVTRRGGGVREWIWKGNPEGTASIEAVIDHPISPIRHSLAFNANEPFALQDERIEDEAAPHETFYYRYQNGAPVIAPHGNGVTPLAPESLERYRSILTQRQDPDHYPVFAQLLNAYEKIRIYREWTLGTKTVFRHPQPADMRNHWLEEDCSNLGLVLNRLRRDPQTKLALLDALKELYHGITDFDLIVEGGTVQVFLTEGDFTIPATRLSDGTLRYLCLLAILCDPNPPPLICLEEPELGIHPDILHKIAELLIIASQRTQLIVTTHSDYLVDAMNERPEVIVVFEKYEGQTEMKRLDEQEMAVWLETYRLGELWTSGQLGGVRW
ncbi:MAG: AAA family ATPase [Acidobacteria bacterium]|nr:AAA family ATPase [Acidobacteriota bacterium]